MDCQTRILQTLFKKGSVTTPEMLGFGAKNPSAVISTLKHRRKIRIQTERINKNGQARYYLIETVENRRKALKEINRKKVPKPTKQLYHLRKLEIIVTNYKYSLIAILFITGIYLILKWANVT